VSDGQRSPAPGERWPFWGAAPSDVLRRLRASPAGLGAAEAEARRPAGGSPIRGAHPSSARLLLRQLANPLVLMLAGSAIVSGFLGDLPDAVIILAIVLVSGLLGFAQEKGAADTMRRLLDRVAVRTTAVRDGRQTEVPVEEIVPGDVVLLSAGSIVPADCRVLEARHCFADEAVLTGETFPVDKTEDSVATDAAPAARSSALFMGTHVVSGTARAVAVRTGADTELGAVSARLAARRPPTEFEHALRRFGYMLLHVTFVLVLLIFAINVLTDEPALSAFMFSLAVAVGLTPQLLPAVVSVNLAHGARRLARAKVIVKRLSSIENFGSMDVLCTDKTGTLTEGMVRLEGAFGASGEPSDDVLELAWLNASLESGFRNPIDETVRRARAGTPGAKKLDEIPYDFVRKRLGVAVDDPRRGPILITKGAFASVLSACSAARLGVREISLEQVREPLERRFAAMSARGLRVLGVATRALTSLDLPLGADREERMVFEGFVAFRDPPKEGIDRTLRRLEDLGVSLKVITGDDARVARALAREVGFAAPVVMSGSVLRRIGDAALPATRSWKTMRSGSRRSSRNTKRRSRNKKR